MMINMDQFFDAWTLRHLDNWLAQEIHGDTCRAEIRVAMLEQAETAPEDYSNQSYWRLFDDAKCEDIRRRFR